MTDSAEIIAARRRLSDAMHAMHVDQSIRVSDDGARELEDAWAKYDAAIRAVPAEPAAPAVDAASEPPGA